MKRLLFFTLLAVSFLTACAVGPGGPYGHRSGNVVIVAPALPSVVVLGIEPFYFYSDFHYHYTNDRWYYSRSKSGPWAKLPRRRYPKEVRHERKKGKYYRKREEYQRDRYRDNDYQRYRDRDNNYQR